MAHEGWDPCRVMERLGAVEPALQEVCSTGRWAPRDLATSNYR